MSAKSFIKLIITIIVSIFIFLFYKSIVYIHQMISNRKLYKLSKELDKNKSSNQQRELIIKNSFIDSYKNEVSKKTNHIATENSKLKFISDETSALSNEHYESFYDYLIKDDFYINFMKYGVEKNIIEQTYYRPASPYIIRKSVTKRIDQISQPKNGYIPIKLFKINHFLDDLDVTPYENKEDSSLFATHIGSIVDYVSRFLYTDNLYSSFYSTIYAFKTYVCFDGGSYPALSKLSFDELIWLYDDFKIKINSIKNLKFNDFSKENLNIIRNIFALVQIEDVLWRVDEPFGLFKRINNKHEFVFKGNREIPDYICKNVLIYIQRTMNFYKSLKNIKFMEVFTNSELITHADCDLISHDTVWDLKVTSLDIYTNHKAKDWTLQVLIYYLMLKDKNHHNYNKYTEVNNIGIFNPFTNTSYKLNMDTLINASFVQEIKDEIIGFNWKPENGLRIDKLSMVKYMKDLLISNNLNIEVYSREFK